MRTSNSAVIPMAASPITGHSEAVRFPAVGISPLNGNRGTMAAHALLVKREILGVGRYAAPFIREILSQ